MSSKEKITQESSTVDYSHWRGFSFEINCVLRRWESKTLKEIINHEVDKVN